MNFFEIGVIKWNDTSMRVARAEQICLPLGLHPLGKKISSSLATLIEMYHFSGSWKLWRNGNFLDIVGHHFKILSSGIKCNILRNQKSDSKSETRLEKFKQKRCPIEQFCVNKTKIALFLKITQPLQYPISQKPEVVFKIWDQIWRKQI